MEEENSVMHHPAMLCGKPAERDNLFMRIISLYPDSIASASRGPVGSPEYNEALSQELARPAAARMHRRYYYTHRREKF